MRHLRYLLALAVLNTITVRLSAQEFAELWILGDPDNGNQSEFSQEQGQDGAPGAADAQDDDFYFAGTYADPIGIVAVAEEFINYDRALVPGDPFNRIHFNLDAVAADPGTQLRLTMQLCCLGAESIHDVTVRFNGTEIYTEEDISQNTLIEETVIAKDVSAVEGANVIEIERTGGNDTNPWVQFDYIRLEAGAIDNDGDGMPDTFEDLYAFLDPQDASDAGLDEDGDGLSNLEEFQVNSDPSKEDTDGDTLNDGDEVKTHQTNPALADSDVDGVDDAAEVNDFKSNPNDGDTDDDGLTDGAEVNEHQTSPTLADSDTDGVDDATEIELATNPNDAQDVPVLFTKLWQLGDMNGNQSEFTQETGADDPPGGADAKDDDYYFAGNYAEIGQVATDEAPANYDRALTGGDPVNRIHFNLDDISASEGAEYRVEVAFVQLGPGDGTSTHDIVMRLNDKEFFSQNEITGDTVVRAVVSGADATTKVGENVLVIERTGGVGWIQFDYLTMEFRTDDTDRDRMPNSYEAKFAFLNPNDASDAAKDEDSDGLSNLEEFQNNTEPAVADTDSDGLNDGPEVKEYGSKPRVPDTDGDGLLDGDEITKQTLVLDADTDDDGLKDGAEIAVGSDPLERDTDGDGESDNDEVLYGTNPADANSVPIAFGQLWQIGEDDEGQGEFSQEGGGAQAAPGSPVDLDDDYYLAGNYPDPIGVVGVDEEWTSFERALTSGDPFNRIHFNLDDELISDTSQMRLHIDFVQLGAVAGITPVHDVVVRVNGTDIFAQTDIVEDTVIQASFLPADVNATAGENIIELERTGQSASSWIQFDFVRLEQRMILTDDPNLLVRTKNIFGELQGLGVQTRTLEITNTGQENTLNISDVLITGADADHYTVSDVPLTLAPREEGSFTIEFDPKGQIGGFTAFLEFTSNDSGEELTAIDLSALIPNANGLVAHYPFDETDGMLALDVSGRGRHGEYVTTGEGVVTPGQDPLAAGKSLSLTHGTGAAFVEISDTFDPFVNVSLSFWFQAMEDPGVLTLISKNLNSETQGDPFAVAYNDGNLFVFAGGSNDLGVGGVAAGEPHHVVVAFDNVSESRSIIVYVDGVEAGSIEGIDGFEDQANSALAIGAMSGAFGFQGQVDDLQIYNKVITAADVVFLQTNPGQELLGEVVVDPDADDDGDGQSNVVEEAAGTDPNDATSFFKLANPVRTDTGLSLNWPSVDGTSYVVEYSETLDEDWVEVTTVTGAEGMTEYIDTDAARTGGAAGYYRLVIP